MFGVIISVEDRYSLDTACAFRDSIAGVADKPEDGCWL